MSANQSLSEPPARDLRAAIKRQALFVVFITAAAIAVAAVITTLQTPRYQASMSLVVGEAGGDAAPDIGNQAITQTLTTLLTSEVVASSTLKKLKLDTAMTSEEFLKKLKVDVLPNSSVLQVSTTDPNPRLAEAKLAEVNRAFTDQLQKKLGVRADTGGFGESGARPLLFAKLYNPPHADPTPISPRRGKTLMTAGVLGLIIGLVLAFVRERFDDRLRTQEEAEDAFRAPVIGRLPARLPRKVTALQPVSSDGRGRSSSGRRTRRDGLEDALQRLGLSFELGRDGDERGSTIVVTSTRHNEGRTALVANIGMVLARDGADVICVDAEGREPQLGSYLREGAAQIVPEATSGPRAERELEELLEPIDVASEGRSGLHGRLRLLSRDGWEAAAQTLPPGERSVSRLLETLGAMADYVIIDSAPLERGEASRLAAAAGNVVVVARLNRTSRTRAISARGQLELLGVNRVGVVLVGAKPGKG